MFKLRKACLEIAVGLPVGDPTRRSLLAALKKASATVIEVVWEGTGPKTRGAYEDLAYKVDIDVEDLDHKGKKTLLTVAGSSSEVRKAVKDLQGVPGVKSVREM